MADEDDVQLKEARANYINDLYNRLSSFHLTTTNKTHTYLFTINAGSAAGLLAYMGSKSGHVPPAVYAGLLVFFVGIMLVGWLHERTYKMLNVQMETLRDKASTYHSKPDNESWQGLIEEIKEWDDKRKKYWIEPIGYASWGCFFLGSASVLISFVC